MAFSRAGSIYGGDPDISRHETDFLEENENDENVQEGNILSEKLPHSKQFSTVMTTIHVKNLESEI